MEYSWVDVPFILECWDLWVKHHGRHRFFQHEKLWGDPDTESRLADDAGGTSGAVRPARDYFAHDYDAFLAKAGQNMSFPGDHTSWIEVHRDTTIPERLLTGPWDDAALQKLFWLVRAGARLAPDQTWEITLEGYRTAMATETTPPTANVNLPVIRLLLNLGGSNHWPRFAYNAELKKLKSVIRHTRGEALKTYEVLYHLVANTYT